MSLNVALGAALAILSAVTFGVYQKGRADSAAVEAEQALSDLAAARETIERTNMALAVEAARRADTEALASRLRKEIGRATSDEDGDVAPVLRRTLDGLRRSDAAGD